MTTSGFVSNILSIYEQLLLLQSRHCGNLASLPKTKLEPLKKDETNNEKSNKKNLISSLEH